MTIPLLGKSVAQAILKKVQERTSLFTRKYRRPPHLTVVLVGEDPASQIYTRKKGETAVSLGMSHHTLSFPASSTPAEIRAVVNKLNLDPNVDGILIQRPLPPSFHEEDSVYWVTPEKDVDAFHPLNAGKLYLGLSALQPCTPTGIMELLYHYEIPIAGKLACIIGRSSLVGKPMAALMLKANATVIHCHSKTPHLRDLTQKADILVVAAGKPGLVDDSYIRSGAVVIDVGIHRTPEGKIVGDAIFDNSAKKPSAVTPVPGGVGPMTIAILMQNTVLAAELQKRENLQ